MTDCVVCVCVLVKLPSPAAPFGYDWELLSEGPRQRVKNNGSFLPVFLSVAETQPALAANDRSESET